MKGFFLLLFITNVGFIGWQFYAAESAMDTPKDPYAGIVRNNDGLMLLSELEETQRPALRDLERAEVRGAEPAVKPPSTSKNIESAATQVQPAIADQCYQSSLLTSLDEAKKLQSTLNKLGIKGSQRSTVEATKVNYWVRLNPYKNRAKAREAADILKKNRVKDFFVVRSGRYENAISLGVFSTRERAQQRYQSIIDLKARLRKPVIDALELPAKRLVVHFRLGPGEQLPTGLKVLLDETKSPHLRKIACKA